MAGDTPRQPAKPGSIACFCLALALVAAAAGCAGRAMMPTPSLYARSLADPFADVPDALKGNGVDLLYVTDRKAMPRSDGRLQYGYGREFSLAFGSCLVSMGKRLSWETLVKESRTPRRSRNVRLKAEIVREIGRYPEAVYPFVPGGGITRDPVYAEAVMQADRALQAEVSRRLSLTPRKRVYVLVHGFANTFDDAAFAMAEMWHFLGREGVPVIYTWPAGHKGLLRGYNYDRESGEFTIYHLKQFLRALAGTPGLGDIVLMAHSRGTDVASSAFRDLFIESVATGADPIRQLKISNMILLAPDLDMEVTTQRFGAEGVMAGANRLTIYVSEHDKAIGVADWLFGSAQRLGKLTAKTLFLKPIVPDFSSRLRANLERLPMAQCIEFRDKTGFIGHAYYRQSPAASSDLILMLRYDKEPGDPARPLKKEFQNYWVIEKGYPAATPR